jgi:hypothetical protein
MAFEPRATSCSPANAQILAQASAVGQGVYTFGQPRVGTKDFADAVNATLGSGIHSMRKHYLVRLETSLPV